MSVKFLSAILAPEMGASILWTPGKMRSFCRKRPMSIKFLVLGGGVFWVLEGGGADFIFMGAGIFLTDFREGDEDSNDSLYRVRRFTESPGPLH